MACEFKEENPNGREKLSSLDKIGWAALGTVAGNLPPRAQLNIAGGNYDKAEIMSNASRVVNPILAAAGIGVGVAARVFGADIDPAVYMTTTCAGGVLALDTVVREGLYAFYYALEHPFVNHLRVWGEPVLSFIDSEKHPEFYKEG